MALSGSFGGDDRGSRLPHKHLEVEFRLIITMWHLDPTWPIMTQFRYRCDYLTPQLKLVVHFNYNQTARQPVKRRTYNIGI